MEEEMTHFDLFEKVSVTDTKISGESLSDSKETRSEEEQLLSTILALGRAAMVLKNFESEGRGINTGSILICA